MFELLQKRSYNSKHFLHPTETNKKIGHFHVGHIHYKDGEEYKDMDHTLIWDETKRGWGFITHSFHPFFPEFSNQWGEFNDQFQDKNQTIRYRIDQETGVKGELFEKDETNPFFDDNPNNKGVIYKNAFGVNRDYILYNTRSSLVKVATVNNPNEQTEDAIFEWEIDLPDKEIFRVEKKEDAEEMTAKETKTNTEDGKLVGYRLRKENAKNFNTNKLTLIGNSKLDGKEWFTYLKSFKAWDSKGNTCDIVARIEFRDGKVYLKKTIPLDFLKNAVGRVFTDTTTSYYAGSGDGMSNLTNNTWNTVHDASSGSSSITGNYYVAGENTASSPTYQIGRIFAPFNTSGIPSSATITAATVYFYDRGISAGTTNVALVQTKQGSVSTLVGVDYIQCGESSALGWGNAKETDIIEGATRRSSFTPTAYNSWSLNATGLNWIAKNGETKPTGAPSSGYTLLGLRIQNDIDDNTPASSPREYRLFHQSEDTVDKDPYLEITYTEGGGPTFLAQIIMS